MPRPVVALVAIALVVSIGCSRQQGDEASFCELVPEVDDLFSLLQGTDTGDPAAVEERFDEGLAEFRALERAAPRTVKPDVAELANVVEDVLEAVQANDGDQAATAAALADLTDTHPGAAASALKVVQYTRDTCGITLDGGPTSVGGTSGGAPPTTG